MVITVEREGHTKKEGNFYFFAAMEVNIDNEYIKDKRKLSDGVHVDFGDEVQYPFAIVGENRLMHISEVTQDNRKQHEYKCPCCKERLSPRLGNKKKHHYSHASGARCDINRYIHDTAKQLLKQRFDSEDNFVVEFDVKKKCKRIDTCFWAKSCRLQRKNDILKRKKFNLKEFYTECLLEKKVDNYIPDLVLQNGEHPPVFIEIWNKHKCSEEKLRAGYKIIEIRLKSVDDLDMLRSGSIVESDKIKFYNFKQVEIEDYLMEYGVQRYSFYESGKYYPRKCTCDEIDERNKKTLVLEVFTNIEYANDKDFVDFCRFIGLDYGISILKNCYICDYCEYPEDGDKSKIKCLKKGADVGRDSGYRCELYKQNQEKKDRLMSKYRNCRYIVVFKDTNSNKWRTIASEGKELMQECLFF